MWSYEYMKIIYVNCGLNNYFKVDDRSYRRNFYSCEKKAWKINKKKKYVAVCRSEVFVKKKKIKFVHVHSCILIKKHLLQINENQQTKPRNDKTTT